MSDRSPHRVGPLPHNGRPTPPICDGNSQSNRRIGFRIDLRQLKQDISNRLRVMVVTDGGQSAVTPVDLSITGICVESEQIIGEHGEHVDVSLSFDDQSIELPAVIVRQDNSNNLTAFQFTGVAKGGEFNPPFELNYIFRALEELWLDSSLNLDGFPQQSREPM